MHNTVKISLKNAVVKCLPVLEPLTHQFKEPHLIWSKSENQSWHGEYKDKPSLTSIFRTSGKLIEDIGSEFSQLFAFHYPEYNGLVGLPSLGLINILNDQGYILRGLLNEIWERHGSFQHNEDAINTIVREFEEFIDLPTVQLRYTAQLLNFHMDEQTIELPENLTIRQLSEEEISKIDGGSIWNLGFKTSRTFGIHEYALEGLQEETKIFDGKQVDISLAYSQQLRQKLNKAILALRTFKEGQVGYNYVRLESIKFCPLPLVAQGYGDLYIPVGTYNISKQEAQALRDHAILIFSSLDASLEMACSRLADAQTRLRPQDRLVDAVIGLESLLLASLGKEDRRGELSYRFALHYSTFFSSPEERYRAFRMAKDLYDLRSTIAHGGTPNENDCRLGDEHVAIDKAAQRACEVLRNVIHHFLPNRGKALYKNSQYWERGYFGLPPDM